MFGRHFCETHGHTNLLRRATTGCRQSMDNVRRCFRHARTSIELRRSYPVVNAGCLSQKGTHWFGQTFRASCGHTNQCHRFVGQDRDDFQRQITGPTLSRICRTGQGRRPCHTRAFGGVAQCRAGVGVGAGVSAGAGAVV